ncbi:hypothetical protein [Streptomyces sp. enrichment culture]|uniref:hypothetical protein n=1 Tax=Streptomyces sp. enrichment culture TaxID=1795815 RepID=UPI003F552DE1
MRERDNAAKRTKKENWGEDVTTSSVHGDRIATDHGHGRKRLREIAVLTAVAVALGVAAPLAHATAAERVAPTPRSTGATAGAQTGLESLESLDEETVFAGLEDTLELITEIPDEVLVAGQEATEQWIRDKLGDSAGQSDPVQSRKFSAGGCARGILLAVGSNILAIGKIYKVKKAIDKLGGVKKVVEKIRDKKKRGKKSFKKAIMEVFEESGTGLGAIAAEILGVDQVVKNCW